MKPLRDKLSYANVMSTIAVFVAFGGSSYAVVSISGSQIKNRSIPAKKLKRNSLGSGQIKERKLGSVPRAANAARVGGVSADQLRVACPVGTVPAANACVEAQTRPPAPYGGASNVCSQTNRKPASRTQGRRLPTYDELQATLNYQEIGLASGGELTSSVLDNGAGTLQVTYMTSEAGSTGLTPDTFEGRKAYRCATDPLN